MKRTSLLALVLFVGCGDVARDCSLPGTICTWAGTGERAFNGDGHPLTETALYWPLDLEFAPDQRGYLVDWQNHRIRRAEADGRVQTVIGTDFVGDGPPDGSDTTAAGAPGTTVELNHPTDLQFASDGSLLVAAWHNHKIRRLDPVTGRVTVVAGAGAGDKGDEGPADRALLNQPKSLAVHATGDIFVMDSRNQRIRRIGADTRRISSVAGTGRIGAGGEGEGLLQTSFYLQQANENPEPGGSIAFDGQGRLYVADAFNNRVRRLDFAAGTVTTIAGDGGAGFAGDGGPAVAAKLNRPRDVEVGPDGRVYIADTDNHRVRAVDPATGTIQTVAGTGQPNFDAGDDGGAATAAALHRPFGIAFDRAGNLYIADTFNNRIRRVAR